MVERIVVNLDVKFTAVFVIKFGNFYRYGVDVVFVGVVYRRNIIGGKL